MIDMTSWPELDVDVLDDVELDPGNIRLEMPVDAPQPDIMRDLFVNGDAFSLVEAIVKVGYLTHETPIVLEHNGRTFVVEGNRRLAALKAIQNPYLIPEFQARITALTRDFTIRDTLRVIRVKKAPDRDQANQLIAAIHTSNIRSRWKPARQAAFFQAQVDAGKTLQVLLAEYPMSSVRRFVRASQLLNKFKNARYRDPRMSDFIHSSKFPVTTLARIYESAEFTRILGIEMRTDGSIRMTITDARFNRVAVHIIGGMMGGDLTARTLPKTSASKFVDLMREIEEIIADSPRRDNDPGSEDATTDGRNSAAQPTRETSGSPSNGNRQRRNGDTPSTPSQSSATTQPSTDPQQQQQRHKSSSVRLDPYNLAVPQNFPVSIHKIFGELIEIHVQKYPNAVMDLLRTFLEKVIKAYARSSGGTIVPRNGSNAQLGDCLVWLDGHVKSLPDHRSLSAIISRIQSRNAKQYPTSAAYLNDINHNPDMHATPGDAHELWEAMVGLMRLMLK